jgi:hypothetical protein
VAEVRSRLTTDWGASRHVGRAASLRCVTAGIGQDRLIPADARSPLLGQVDPYGDLQLAPNLMPGLIAEISALLWEAHTGPGSRGLRRLLALAEA